MPDPLTLASTPSDHGKQYKVQTGSSNNLATETDVNAISVAIPMFWEQVFKWCIRQHHPTLQSPRNSKISDGYQSPEVVITLRRKPTST